MRKDDNETFRPKALSQRPGCAALALAMPSTGPPTIPLHALPFLNTRDTRNGEILADQPAIGRHSLSNGDDDDEEEEADADADADAEGADENGYPHRHPAAASARARARARGGRASPSMMITPAWRLHLYNLLERPNSSAAAVLVHVLVTFLIVFSALVTILETVPGALHSLPGGLWFGLETSLVALFTVEYVARCAATSYSWSGLFGWVGCALFFSPSSPSSFFFFFLFCFAANVDPDFCYQHQRSLASWTFWLSFLTT